MDETRTKDTVVVAFPIPAIDDEQLYPSEAISIMTHSSPHLNS
jgi:hypothetical protein